MTARVGGRPWSDSPARRNCPTSPSRCAADLRGGTSNSREDIMNKISQSAGDMGGSAKTTAAKAGDNPVVEWGARLGYGANGVIHLLLAFLVVQIAREGGGDKQASQSGALSTLAKEPAGQGLLWVIGVGVTLLAPWQLTEGFTEHEAFD